MVAALREQLSLFALALRRATVLRIGAAPAADAASERASVAHLPGAGWVVGLAGCIVFALVALALRASAWGALVAAVAATAATAVLTRGEGERGLFRAMERLQWQDAPGTSGTGTLALVLLVAARLALLVTLASLSESAVMAALFAGPVASRLAPLLLARSLAGDLPPRAVQLGALWCVPPLLLLWPAAGLGSLLLAIIAAMLACYGMWLLARRQAEGPDRDLLAAAQQASELALYLGIAVGL